MSAPLENEAISEESYLLAQVAQGDRDAFRLVYARYSGPLFSLAIRFLGDAGEAEEAMQDTFVKLWRNAAAFEPAKARPFTWAVTIMRRTCIDRLRKRQRTVVTTPLAEAGAEAGPPGRDQVRRAAEAAEDAARVQQALAGFGGPQRRALELVLFHDLSHAEIAARLNQPVGSVKSWIRRGLLGLRATLTDPVP